MSESENDYKVIILGAGPAGYVAAIRCAQLGMKTACIDNWNLDQNKASPGGNFVNAGCISSMILLESSKLFDSIQNEAHDHGISVENTRIDASTTQNRKQRIIDSISKQISQLFEHHQIDFIHAQGKLISSGQVEIKEHKKSTKRTLNAEHIILATGSKPAKLACADIDGDAIIDSTEALNLDEIPKRLGIIGAGLIGLELAGIWRRLGSEVILLEAQDVFLPSTDSDISQSAYQIFTDQGLDIRLGARVIDCKKGKKKVTVEYQDQSGTHSLRLDKLFVASGREPNSETLASDQTDLMLDENGFVHVDDNCCTTLPGVYAIGDLTTLGPMLAHKGLEEGIFVAELIAEQAKKINYNIIPNVIYTSPEIAWVGQSEQALQAINENYQCGVFPFKASTKAQAIQQTEGLVKIISQQETDVILGVHIINDQASELIAEAVLAMEFSASAEDLARTIHAHPSVSEALHEAALNLEDRALHLLPTLQNHAAD